MQIVKIFFIVIIAKLIVSFSNERRLDHILSLGAMTGILLIYFGMIIVLSSDLGSGLVYLFIFIAMLFAGGLKIYWFLIAFAGFAIVSPYIWNSFLSDNQKNRIIAVFDPKSVDPTGLGITWQVEGRDSLGRRLRPGARPGSDDPVRLSSEAEDGLYFLRRRGGVRLRRLPRHRRPSRSYYSPLRLRWVQKPEQARRAYFRRRRRYAHLPDL